MNKQRKDRWKHVYMSRKKKAEETKQLTAWKGGGTCLAARETGREWKESEESGTKAETGLNG